MENPYNYFLDFDFGNNDNNDSEFHDASQVC